MPVITPVQFTTADGSLVGHVDGVNLAYSFTPLPRVLLYDGTGSSGSLLFRNGHLLDDQLDYTYGRNFYALGAVHQFDTFAAELFFTSAPTRLRASNGGLTFTGDNQHLRLSPLSPTFSTNAAFMLFRNGDLLTNGPDYTTSGVWIALALGVIPTDIFTALISMGGIACTSFDGTIGGAIDGINTTFTLPFSTSQQMIFRNGQLLIVGQDYLLVNQDTPLDGPGGPALPNTDVPDDIIPGFGPVAAQPGFILLGPPPQVGDILTAQIYAVDGPLSISIFDGTITQPVATEALLYRNGVFMTQPLDGSTSGNTATLSAPQVAQLTDVVTLEAWTPDVSDASALPFNLPQQFSTNDGSITGTRDGSNNVFVIVSDALVTDFLLSYNGLEMTDGVDYSWASAMNFSSGPWVTTITMKAGQNPNADDVLTAEVFGS